MEENNKAIEEQENDKPVLDDDTLKDAIEEQLSKIRTQSMILGFRVACQTVLDKISAFERAPGSKSNNDHKRIIKDIKKFAETGLSRKMNENSEIEVPGSETVQN
jgi:hypothetical protein